MAITPLSLTDFTSKTKYPDIDPNNDAMRQQMSGPSNDIKDYINNTLIPQVASLDSPALTGTPTSTTPVAGDNSKKIVTTEFIAPIGSQVYSHKDDNFTSYATNANIISFTLADAGTYILSAAFQADSTQNARADIYAYYLENSIQHSISKTSFPYGQDHPCANLCGAFTANAGDTVKMDYWGASSQSFSHSCNIIRIR